MSLVGINTERSHSGRVRTLGKRVVLNGARGFESPPLLRDKGTLVKEYFRGKEETDRIGNMIFSHNCQKATNPLQLEDWCAIL